MAFLEVKNFYKSFGDTKVLKGVDFDLEKGQIRDQGLASDGDSGALSQIHHGDGMQGCGKAHAPGA